MPGVQSNLISHWSDIRPCCLSPVCRLYLEQMRSPGCRFCGGLALGTSFLVWIKQNSIGQYRYVAALAKEIQANDKALLQHTAHTAGAELRAAAIEIKMPESVVINSVKLGNSVRGYPECLAGQHTPHYGRIDGLELVLSLSLAVLNTVRHSIMICDRKARRRCALQ